MYVVLVVTCLFLTSSLVSVCVSVYHYVIVVDPHLSWYHGMDCIPFPRLQLFSEASVFSFQEII